MKRIEVLVRAFQLSELTRAIRGIPISGVTATELWDARCGRAERSWPIVKVEVVVHDELVARVFAAIQGAAERCRIGALVLVGPVLAATGLPNGEIDEAAIG